jgi:hypothetical protein
MGKDFFLRNTEDFYAHRFYRSTVGVQEGKSSGKFIESDEFSLIMRSIV